MTMMMNNDVEPCMMKNSSSSSYNNNNNKKQQQLMRKKQKIISIHSGAIIRVFLVVAFVLNSLYWVDVVPPKSSSTTNHQHQQQEQQQQASSSSSSSSLLVSSTLNKPTTLPERQHEQHLHSLSSSSSSTTTTLRTAQEQQQPPTLPTLPSTPSPPIIHRKLHIGIFVAVDRRSQQQLYDDNLRSIRCYGKRHGYDVIIMENNYYNDEDVDNVDNDNNGNNMTETNRSHPNNNINTNTTTNNNNNKKNNNEDEKEESILIPSLFVTNPNIKSLQDIYPTSSSSTSSSTSSRYGGGGNGNGPSSLSSSSNKSSCHTISSFSFRRQCVVTHIVQHYDFLVVLDADCGVANANKTIESILLRTVSTTSSSTPSSSLLPALKHQQQLALFMTNATAGIDDDDDDDEEEESFTHRIFPSVIHEERFHTGEIMAASYIVQNTDFAHRYLQKWGQYYHSLPNPEWAMNGNNIQGRRQYVNKFYHNQRDNPALNLVFLETLAQQQQQQEQLRTMVKSPRNVSNGYGDRSTNNNNKNVTEYTGDRTGFNSYNQSIIDDCHRYWKLARGNPRYMTYLSCIQRGIAQIVDDSRRRQIHPTITPTFDHDTKTVRDGDPHKTTMWPNRNSPLYLFRRGHGGLGRDINTCNGMVSPMDVFVHNLKPHSSIIEHAKGFYTKQPTCDDDFDGQSSPSSSTTTSTSLSDWQAPVDPNRWLTIEQMQDLMKTQACMAKVTKVGECWPDCTL